MKKFQQKQLNLKSKPILFGFLAVILGIALGLALPKPKPLSVNEVSAAVASGPYDLVSSTIFDSDAAIASSGWKLLGYKGIVPYIESGFMAVPGPITDLTILWNKSFNIPTSSISGNGLLIEVTLLASSSSKQAVPFKLVAGLSEDVYLDSPAFAAAESQASTENDLLTYRFLFTPNQFSGIETVKAMTIGLNPTSADVQSMVIKDISVKILQ